MLGNYYDKDVFMETVHPLFTYYDQCVTTLQLCRDYLGTGSVRGDCVHKNKKYMIVWQLSCHQVFQGK